MTTASEAENLWGLFVTTRPDRNRAQDRDDKQHHDHGLNDIEIEAVAGDEQGGDRSRKKHQQPQDQGHCEPRAHSTGGSSGIAESSICKDAV